jgi:predicted amidophosphoribosyltransferase
MAAQSKNKDWSVWKSILEQMDNGGRPSPGMCANCNKKAHSDGHIYCEGCRVERQGYPFARA